MNSSPTFAPFPLLAETLGQTDDQHRYIYVSDGGHFENLGLYEMVRRRCHHIVVSDGSEDGDLNFESLGNALNKIRADLGIRITFDSIPISRREPDPPPYAKSEKDEKDKKYCAIGTIHYSDVDGKKTKDGKAVKDGTLVYIKPAFYGTEPADVYNYAKANPAFPHESTGDQMYSESQFESYRALGRYVIERILAERDAGSLSDFEDKVREYLGEPKGSQEPGVQIPLDVMN